MTSSEIKKYIEDVLNEVELMNSSDQEIRMHLLHLSHKVLQKAKQGREEHQLHGYDKTRTLS